MANIFLEKLKVNIIPIIAMIMFAFFPTSFGGVIGGNLYIIGIWGMLTLFVLYTILNNAVDISRLKLALGTIVYMMVVTVIQLCSNEGARISIARVAPVVVLLLTSSIVIKKVPKFELMEKLVTIFSVICIIWNVGIITSFGPIVQFTYAFFSQYYDRALFYSMLYQKPVMSFGVHTYAAFFYFLMFCCYYGMARERKKKRDYIFCMIYILLTMLLTSSSSIVYAVIEVGMFLWLVRKKVHIILGIAAAGVVVLIRYGGLLIKNYGIFLTDSGSGFLSRYVGSDIFAENIEVIKRSLGVGFCIVDGVNIRYSDSGYVVYATMGGIVFVFLLYSLIALYIKNNIPKPYNWILLFIILSFEIALPGTFSYRFVFALIFVTCFFRALHEKTGKN